jgi:hypothetical protein
MLRKRTSGFSWQRAVARSFVSMPAPSPQPPTAIPPAMNGKDCGAELPSERCQEPAPRETAAKQTWRKRRSDERTRVLNALAEAGGNLGAQEIMTATGRTDSNAVYQLLFKMARDGDIVKVSRGHYALAHAPLGNDVKNGNPDVRTC